MKRNVSFLLILILLSAVFFPIVSSSEFLDYDPVANVCVVYPSGGDDTSNLQEAFDTVVVGGLGGEVRLVEGTYTISAPLVVVNFDGWFHGEEREKTLVENMYTESWPLPSDATYQVNKRGSPYMFLFYQTDDVLRTLRFSDMSLKFNGRTVQDPNFMNATGLMFFKVHGKVDLDDENLHESEINTIFERMHFEGESTHDWMLYNALGCIFVSGEPLPNIEFKPLAGTHIIDNCTFYNTGGSIRYDTMTEHIIVTNNEFMNIGWFGIWPRNTRMPQLGTYYVVNNQFSNCTMMDVIIFHGIDNSVIKNNNISGSLAGGLFLSGSNHNYIQGNNITDCSLYGIKLQTSNDNIIINNFVQTNGTDLIWDGYGENIWMRNEFNTVNNTDIIDSNEATIRNLGSQLEEMNSEKQILENDLESAYAEISELEVDLGEINVNLSDLEDQLSTANYDIADLGNQIESLQEEIESLEEDIASRLTYTTAGIIAIIAAIIFGAAGFYAAKRM